jgi:hypothetical protein
VTGALPLAHRPQDTMRTTDFYDGRREPALGQLASIEDLAGTWARAHTREPTMQLPEFRGETESNDQPPILVDVFEPHIYTKDVDNKNAPPAYRLIDWLSAIALLVASAAFILTLDGRLF